MGFEIHFGAWNSLGKQDTVVEKARLKIEIRLCWKLRSFHQSSSVCMEQLF